LPMALLMILSSVFAARLVTRIGLRATMAAGVFLGSTGLVLMASLVSVDGGYLSVIPGMLAMGLGIGLAMTPATEAITSSLPRERQGVASALNDVTREFGTALGVALLGAILTAGYRTSIDSRLDGIPTDLADTAREGVANAVAAAPGTSPQAQALVRAAQDSFVEGWQNAMWVGAAVMGVLFIYVLLRGPRRAAAAGNSPDTGSDAPAAVAG
jgi:MFS family permease